MIHLPIGSYSCGSLEPPQIAAALLDMLNRVGHINDELREELVKVAADGGYYCRIDEEDIINDAINVLKTYLLPFCYIGLNPSNLSDFGVWPDADAIADACRNGEILKLGDLAELAQIDPFVAVQYSYVAVVNDHGNLELYPIRVTVGDCLFSVV